MPTTEFKVGGGWIDSHCHLNDLSNLDQNLEDAAQHQIESFVIPGTMPAQWKDAFTIRSPQVFCAAGTHPWYVTNPTQDIEALEQWLKNQPAVAVGEIGLDYYQGKTPRPEKLLQLEAFEGQLELAKHNELPVILHCVKAHNDMLQLLKKHGVHGGVVHAFSGSAELAQSYVALGLHIGVGPMILKSPKTLQAVSKIPVEKILLETDAPFMASQPLTEANPLLDLLRVAEALAEQKSITMDELQNQTKLNTQKLFGINSQLK
ncbi:TatD family hydrolase [Reinekea marina]|uniref:TatD family hydrolase n=2 Tax=Reinekea marina TaxID=1310421 RepID=A0ABV7WQX4_9GAMM